MVNIFYFISIYGKYIFWLEIGQKLVSSDKTTSFYGCNFFLKFCISKRRRFALRGFKTALFWISCRTLKTTSFWFLIHINDAVFILHLKKIIIINNETTSFCLLQRRNNVASATLKCLTEELVPWVSKFRYASALKGEGGGGGGGWGIGSHLVPASSDGDRRRQPETKLLEATATARLLTATEVQPSRRKSQILDQRLEAGATVTD